MQLVRRGEEDEMPALIIFGIVFGSLAIPSSGLTCPKASLDKCIASVATHDHSCNGAASWLSRYVILPATLCIEERNKKITKCRDNCPTETCITCFKKVKKAVDECRDFHQKLKDVMSDCDTLERTLIHHCADGQICKVCRDSYCQNGGICRGGPSVTSCKCPKGFTGVYCHISECDSQLKCRNGGTCVGKNKCSCPTDYAGSKCERLRLGTETNPAPNAQAILNAGDSFGSGLYWIKPLGETSAAITYCDMINSDGGWMLASYGYVAASSSNARNKAIPNMNNPMGYTWKPDRRQSSNGLVNLTSGAVMMARNATYMIMAAGNNPNTGGIDNYNYVYRIDLRQNAFTITFANHNRYHGATGTGGIPQMHMTEFIVEGLKGDKGEFLRYAFGESLGVTWSDSYPTGYGFNDLGMEYGTWNNGPFFPSVHSGDGSSCSGCKIYQPDIQKGKEDYVHRGWYTATGITGLTGQTSIWFK